MKRINREEAPAGQRNGQNYCVTYTLDEQAEHIAAILKEAQRRHARVIEPTEEAEKQWVATIRAKSGAVRKFQQQCTPNYQNSEGSTKFGMLDEVYGGGAIEFYDLVRRWRTDGQMEGLEMR